MVTLRDIGTMESECEGWRTLTFDDNSCMTSPHRNQFYPGVAVDGFQYQHRKSDLASSYCKELRRAKNQRQRFTEPPRQFFINSSNQWRYRVDQKETSSTKNRFTPGYLVHHTYLHLPCPITWWLLSAKKTCRIALAISDLQTQRSIQRCICQGFCATLATLLDSGQLLPSVYLP